jgi:hypothetical protein
VRWPTSNTTAWKHNRICTCTNVALAAAEARRHIGSRQRKPTSTQAAALRTIYSAIHHYLRHQFAP